MVSKLFYSSVLLKHQVENELNPPVQDAYICYRSCGLEEMEFWTSCVCTWGHQLSSDLPWLKKKERI